MYFKRASITLTGIMVFVAMAILISTLTVLYRTAFDQTRSNLARTAISQARLLESVAHFDRIYSTDYPNGATAAALSQMADAYRSLERVGTTGEFVVGRRHGDEIEFLMVSPPREHSHPEAVAFGSEFAEPMHRALSGNAGTMVGRDYSGTPVLAAYQPVSVLDLGIVVKIDLAEIRAPFVRTGSALILLALLLTLMGSFLFFRVTNPLIRRTEESEKRYQRAVAGTNDGLWDCNIRTGRCYFSPRWAEILGFEVDELKPVVETFSHLIHADDKDRAWRAVRAHLERRIHYDMELRMRKKGGDYIWVRARARAVWDENDQPLHMAGSITDISKRKKYEAALEQSEAQFRKVLETIEIATVVINAEGSIQIFNPAAEEVFGYEEDEAVGRNVSMLMPEPDHARHDGYLQHYLDTGEAKILGVGRQVVGLRKNGEQFPMQLAVGEMQVDNEICFVGSIADLTELQSLESQLRQAQKLETVGQLTGGVAHDFNNLLAVIQGNLEMLAEDLKSESGADVDEHLERIQQSLKASKRGAELTYRLLAFSRKQTLQPRAVNLNELITGMEDLLRRTLGETIDLSVVFEQRQWRAMIDPSQMENALLNLVLNARDAMPDGGRMTIKTDDVTLDEAYRLTHPEANIGDFITLTVSDTGSGMTAEVMARVFDPFFTTKGVGKGSGLGLSMVHGFVKQSGGLIEFSSTPGEGTSVTLHLPRSLEGNESEQKPDVTSHRHGHETILVVEDNEQVRLMTVRMLTRLGYQIFAVCDGRTALNTLEHNDPIDLLLTDVVLSGGMNGSQLATEVRAIKPAIKVLFMSGYTDNAIVHNGRVDEGAHLLNKPFTLNDLSAKVREVLENPL